MDRLQIYNRALFELGERSLASLSENREPRRVLDEVWDYGAIDYCLEEGLWRFATKSVSLLNDPGLTPPYGFQYTFQKPDDFIRTTALCGDEDFLVPLNHYVDEAGYWFANLETIYVKYVSNGVDYGNDLSLWPKSFAEYVALYIAYKAAPRLTQSASKQDVIKAAMDKALSKAKSKDAMSGPTVSPPPGDWASSRVGNRYRRDGGGRGTLIG